jgi:hypothetical protein
MLAGVRLLCLGVTSGGEPRHPLYVRADVPLVPFPVPVPRPAASLPTAQLQAGFVSAVQTK